MATSQKPERATRDRIAVRAPLVGDEPAQLQIHVLGLKMLLCGIVLECAEKEVCSVEAHQPPQHARVLKREQHANRAAEVRHARTRTLVRTASAIAPLKTIIAISTVSRFADAAVAAPPFSGRPAAV
eukprot:5262522-Pleurochrysis_carterae.AAC.2